MTLGENSTSRVPLPLGLILDTHKSTRRRLDIGLRSLPTARQKQQKTPGKIGKSMPIAARNVRKPRSRIFFLLEFFCGVIGQNRPYENPAGRVPR